MTVTLDNADEFDVHQFASEASSLGLRTGEWPEQLTTNLGNQLPFLRRSKKVDAEGDLMWVTYQQANGCLSLRVYND